MSSFSKKQTYYQQFELYYTYYYELCYRDHPDKNEFGSDVS